jgi:N-ethylmaleimide reductase
MSEKLFQPYKLGPLTLKNRMVMAPMTRSRADFDGVQSPLASTYYSQRASAGLIITEGSQVSAQGVGYVKTPGVYTRAQIEAWKRTTDAVHEAGGLIFIQLWHVGRVSHPDFHGGELPVGPSAVGYEGEVFTPEGKKKVPVPRALRKEELPGIVEQFSTAARNAKEAGFDGAELHGANGYLLDQFLRDTVNQRTDEYGGSIENRVRFPLEVARAVAGEFGADRLGYRISPINGAFNGMSGSHLKETYGRLVSGLNELNLAYLHILEPQPGHMMAAPADAERLAPGFRKIFRGTLMLNGGYTKELATEAIESEQSDLISFGVPFLANPDLPKRFVLGAQLNPPQWETFYQGEDKGYIDYPLL